MSSKCMTVVENKCSREHRKSGIYISSVYGRDTSDRSNAQDAWVCFF